MPGGRPVFRHRKGNPVMFTRLCTGEKITDQTIIKYCPHARLGDNEDDLFCVKTNNHRTLRSCYKCHIYKKYRKAAKLAPKEERPVPSSIVEGSCKDIADMYAKTVPLIRASAEPNLNMYLDQHILCIEDRKDFSECQKGSRRKIVLGMWSTYKERKANENLTAETPQSSGGYPDADGGRTGPAPDVSEPVPDIREDAVPGPVGE